jgi:hypothetical protein
MGRAAVVARHRWDCSLVTGYRHNLARVASCRAMLTAVLNRLEQMKPRVFLHTMADLCFDLPFVHC